MLLLSACLPSRVPYVDTGPGPGAPAIVDAAATCDAEGAEWSFTVDTDAWTGGGDLWLSADGDYVEAHELISTGSAGDGSADHLEQGLDVVADWRDQGSGSSTVFNCDWPELAGVMVVYERDGETIADGRSFGVEPSRWAAWDLGVSCDVVLDEG